MQRPTTAHLLTVFLPLAAFAARDVPFNAGWRFERGDVPGAEAPGFDDSAWRVLDVPHDWSIEDLPALAGAERVGPFAPKEAPGGHFTAYTLGGTAWYRHTFATPSGDRRVAVRFDGVYRDSEVFLNGQRVGENPHGYTSFECDLTPHLSPTGQTNTLAVRVRNEGRSSRWYSGSGIFRQVWLTERGPLHVPTWGVFVTTPEVSAERALVKLSVEVRNTSARAARTRVAVQVRDAAGNSVGAGEASLALAAGETRTTECFAHVRAPQLWSPDKPALHTAEVSVLEGETVLDAVAVPFGIRSVSVDSIHGFRLNGETLKLAGCCIHHDNGPLGSAAIARAEERKVELLKAQGFNAVRTSHNPPSSAFLEACDRLGLLVIVEAFDQWNRSKEKNEQDYHVHFDAWAERDVAAMVRRDRNHPSVIFWSIGNEIPEQFHAPATQRRLRDAVLAHDPTRPVTQAICTDWGEVIKHWDERSDPAFGSLDVAGYNYLPEKYEGDHARHPDRVLYGAESFPKDALLNWSLVEKHPYVIGDFVWTGMDYLGEAGLAHALTSDKKDSFFMSWPWFNAWCGDLDLCGFSKPQALHRDVVWRRSAVEILVHAPLAEGLTENVSWWGWPDEQASWTWPGAEGRPLQVSVHTRGDTVRLLLNGVIVGEQPASEATKLVARFEVPYAPGELRAVALSHGRVLGERVLATVGPAKALRLTADRTVLRADRGDLAYVTVEVVDADDRRVPGARVPVRLNLTGVGEIAGHANAAPDEPASFRGPVRPTFQGRALVVLRPSGTPGTLTLRAEADGLQSASLDVHAR